MTVSQPVSIGQMPVCPQHTRPVLATPVRPQYTLPVLVTPLRPSSAASLPPVATSASCCIIDKVILKAVSKTGKHYKLFTLRSIDCNKVVSREDLKAIIRRQLQDDIKRRDFDIGVVSGSSVISIRTQADLSEFWSDIKKKKNLMLWCDGLRNSSEDARYVAGNKRSKHCLELDQSEGSESDEEVHATSRKSGSKKKKKTAQEEREERVQSSMKALKEKHGASFTPMQYRIWCEMIVGGLHTSVDDPPTSSMFVRAGKNDSSGKKKGESSAMAEALTQAAVAISTALSPQSNAPNPTRASPAKLIESRSKCYKQLSDLNNLKVSGVLTAEEYLSEKDAVLAILRKLKGD